MEMAQGSILVVEDMPQIRGLLEVTLRFEGYTVDSASDGREALEKIRQTRPALVITDILMPRMDGYALVYQLRKDPQTRDIPVIFLSATYVTPEDKDFALSLGAVKFLEKPIDTPDFLLTIGETLAEQNGSSPRPMDDKLFFMSYRRRLENKLRQKNQQIARTERLLKTLPPAQTPTFQGLLEEARAHRDGIAEELNDVMHRLTTMGEGATAG